MVLIPTMRRLGVESGKSGVGMTRVWREGGECAEVSGWRTGRSVGVTNRVTVRPRVSNRRVRSRRGMMWPDEG